MGVTRKRPTPVMRSCAKALRKLMTDEEKSLWYDLKDLRKEGIRFRKQVPIGRYIVDFACLNAKLIIEVDGLQHSEPDHLSKDETRDNWLQFEGYKILRFWNDEIRKDKTQVLNTIFRALPLEGGGGRSEAKVGGGETL